MHFLFPSGEIQHRRPLFCLTDSHTTDHPSGRPLALASLSAIFSSAGESLVMCLYGIVFFFNSVSLPNEDQSIFKLLTFSKIAKMRKMIFAIGFTV